MDFDLGDGMKGTPFLTKHNTSKKYTQTIKWKSNQKGRYIHTLYIMTKYLSFNFCIWLRYKHWSGWFWFRQNHLCMSRLLSISGHRNSDRWWWNMTNIGISGLGGSSGCSCIYLLLISRCLNRSWKTNIRNMDL